MPRPSPRSGEQALPLARVADPAAVHRRPGAGHPALRPRRPRPPPKAIQNRDVWTCRLPDGMAMLGITTDAATIAAMAERIRTAAHDLQAARGGVAAARNGDTDAAHARLQRRRRHRDHPGRPPARRVGRVRPRHPDRRARPARHRPRHPARRGEQPRPARRMPHPRPDRPRHRRLREGVPADGHRPRHRAPARLRPRAPLASAEGRRRGQ